MTSEQTLSKRDISNVVWREDFYAFAQRVFEILHPGTAIIPNWHLDAICHGVIDFLDGDDLHLVVNVPPRSLKSILLSVALPAYLLGRSPTMRILCASYSAELAEALARDTRTVMQSPWYRRLFPGTIVARANAEEIATTQRGFRRATGVGGSVTGFGCDLAIIDDPLKPEDALSDPIREKTNGWFGTTLASRANDKRKSKTLLVMQRVHVDDPSSLLLARGATRHLCLPAVADCDRVVPLSLGRSHAWFEGEPLQGVREPPRVLERERERLGDRNFSAQYLQAPVPIDGGMIKFSWFQRYDAAPVYRPGDRLIFSWDPAMTDGLNADYSVCTAWVVRGKSYYLIDVIRERLLYPDLKRKIAGQARTHPHAVIIIEDKGSGISVAQDLKRDGIGVVKFKPEGSKEMRASIASDQIESGNVFIPQQAHWLREFELECLAFPRGRHDDQIDSMSQAIIWNLEKQRFVGQPLFGSY